MPNSHSVADLALSVPRSIPVLERLRIDYCCHGGQTIEDACRRADVTPKELLQLIREEPSRGPVQSWEGAPLTAIIGFIVGTHHAYTRTALESLQILARKVALPRVEQLVSDLTTDLLPHMMKEEQILFPYVEELEKAELEGKDPAPPIFGTVRNPIRMMLAEHELVVEKLVGLRSETSDCAVPAFSELLDEFEQDIHRHIHLENNLLFPRLLTLEINALQTTGAAW